MATHEDFRNQHELTGSSDRSFGLVFAGFFTIVGLWPLKNGLPVRIWALGLAAAFLVVSLTIPKILGPLNKIWTKLGILIGKITNPIVTAALFFGIFTPIAALLRASGKDLLRLRMDKDARSYWIDRTPPGPEPPSMVNQF